MDVENLEVAMESASNLRRHCGLRLR